jgi:pyrroline-5-carboxylate reductase
MNKLTVVFWGGGAMGEAMVAGLGRSGVSMSRVRVIEVDSERRRVLRERYGNEIVLYKEAADDMFRGADLVVLCLKPQVAVKALHNVHLAPAQVVVSIMAGLTAATVSRLLGGHEAVVRCMPNTPAQVFKSVSVYCCAPSITQEQRAKVLLLLASLGDCHIDVADESYIDKATGVSGSGPGFVFVIFEAFMDAAVELGFTRAQAQDMTLQLFDGCVALARASPDKHVAQLRNQVTSPGGTTAAGLAALEEAGVRGAVRAAIVAATRKSEELGKSKL